MPEQRSIEVRDPSELTRAPIPRTERPPTVSNPRFDAPPHYLSLDEAIGAALANARVVRVLAGVTAVASGRTIYDTAVINTGIDQQQARFDPTAQLNNNWNRFESPGAILDPNDPTQSLITGGRTDNYALDFGLTKTTITGGEVAFGVNSTPSRFRPGVFPLNPQDRSSLDLSFTQPLLQGGGVRANLIPIVLARIDTERSYFQFKDGVQELVRGVIDAYWAVVFARTDVWAREQQVEQAEFANDLTGARFRANFDNQGDYAQTRVALANFRSALIAARANLLQREAALRNIIGLPPFEPTRLTPVTPPRKDRKQFDWQALLELAEMNRPDIIELKLILEADEQLLLQRRNDANPRLDAVALYRWNGLSGTMPNGMNLSSRPGQFADWTLGINFSVPLSLRRERALVRRQELVIARDRANLQQGLHGAAHTLAINLRNLDQFYEQYLAAQEIRAAARDNLDNQMARYRARLTQYINVLQAIVDWGNAISSEARFLTFYNTELANLERQTGAILETHGIAFVEEQFGAVGPLGRFASQRCYAEALYPTSNDGRYPTTERPAEEAFNLQPPPGAKSSRRRSSSPEYIPPPPRRTPPVR